MRRATRAGGSPTRSSTGSSTTSRTCTSSPTRPIRPGPRVPARRQPLGRVVPGAPRRPSGAPLLCAVPSPRATPTRTGTGTRRPFSAGRSTGSCPETIHFKRRRKESQFVVARTRQVLTRPSEFQDYAWWHAGTAPSIDPSDDVTDDGLRNAVSAGVRAGGARSSCAGRWSRRRARTTRSVTVDLVVQRVDRTDPSLQVGTLVEDAPYGGYRDVPRHIRH